MVVLATPELWASFRMPLSRKPTDLEMAHKLLDRSGGHPLKLKPGGKYTNATNAKDHPFFSMLMDRSAR